MVEKTNLSFEWKDKSLNENAIRVLKEKGIPFRYSAYFELEMLYCGKYRLVQYKKNTSNIYEIYVELGKEKY